MATFFSEVTGYSYWKLLSGCWCTGARDSWLILLPCLPRWRFWFIYSHKNQNSRGKFRELILLLSCRSLVHHSHRYINSYVQVHWQREDVIKCLERSETAMWRGGYAIWNPTMRSASVVFVWHLVFWTRTVNLGVGIWGGLAMMTTVPHALAESPGFKWKDQWRRAGPVKCRKNGSHRTWSGTPLLRMFSIKLAWRLCAMHCLTHPEEWTMWYQVVIEWHFTNRMPLGGCNQNYSL